MDRQELLEAVRSVTVLLDDYWKGHERDLTGAEWRAVAVLLEYAETTGGRGGA